MYKKLKKKDLDVVLKYLPYFKDKTNSLYTIENGNFYDTFKYSNEVYQFINILYKHNFIIVFDHPSWQFEALKYIENSKTFRISRYTNTEKVAQLFILEKNVSVPAIWLQQ